MSESPRILIVDDDPLHRELLRGLLLPRGYQVETCRDGAEGWRRLEQDGPTFDVILLDWVMPQMDGFELLTRIQEHPRWQRIPVIMQTGKSEREDMLKGIEAGAAYYVTKPFDSEIVLTMVATAARDRSRHRAAQVALSKSVEAIASLKSGTFRFNSPEEASGLATLLSRGLPDPDSAAMGLGELLLNGVEHGNLGISYQDKSELLASSTWRQEVERRLQMPEYLDRFVEVDFLRSATQVRIEIRDEGEGFDWEPYLNIAPERVFHLHGRGIAMARRVSFDHLEYHAPGNRVVVTIELGAEPS